MNAPDEEHARRKTANLAAAAVLLALAIAGVWLLRYLDERRRLEQCLEAGRTDCLRRFEF